MECIFDQHNSIAVIAVISLFQLAQYGFTCLDLVQYSPIHASKNAMGKVIWQFLIASLLKLSNRFSKLFQTILKHNNNEAIYDIQLHQKPLLSFNKKSITNNEFHNENDIITEQSIEQQVQEAKNRALRWIELILIPCFVHIQINVLSQVKNLMNGD